MAVFDDPRALILELVRDFVQAFGRGRSVAELETTLEEDGDLQITATPISADSAAVTVRVTPSVQDGFVVYVFIANSFTPIEISGPVDMNHGRSYRPAGELILKLLEATAHGHALAEIDSKGQVIRTYLPSVFPEEAEAVHRVSTLRPLGAW